MANNHPYVTYFNSPIQIGSGIDNTSSPDSGDIVLTQAAVIAGSGSVTIQLPIGATILSVTAKNFSGAALTAGTVNVRAGQVDITGAVNLSTLGVSTNVDFSYAGALVAANVGTNNILTFTTAALAPAGGNIGVVITYKLLVTP